MPSILVIDNSVLVRQGLRHMLDHEYRGVIFGEAREGESALAQLAKVSWDLVVLDASLSGQDSFSLLGEIQRLHPSVPVLVMSTRVEFLYAARARQMGAAGYISKDCSRADLVKAIRNVVNGKTHFEQLRLPGKGGAMLAKVKGLSPREYRVMLALGNGKRATDIATELNLSIKTISTYKRRILNKLQIDTVADLIRYVVERRLS